MFDDIDSSAIVIKARYDGVYFIQTEGFSYKTKKDIDPGLFKNVFYSINDSTVFRNWFLIGQQKFADNFNIYQLPTVMYTRQMAGQKLHIHSFPHDISLIFNKEAIIYYAKHYTDFILNQAVLTHDITDEKLWQTNYYLGLNIHISLGKFFNFIGFNQLEYTPRDVNNNPINMFGATLRELVLEKDSDWTDIFLSDVHDNYKVNWYSGYWNLRYMIEERFGKNVNT